MNALDRRAQDEHHRATDPHVRGRWIADVVLGAQDGLVNTLGVVLGVAAAGASSKIVFAAGLAASGAEAISMAAVAYTSQMALGDLFLAEREREYRHLEEAPDVERDEVRALYARKGFSGELLDRVVDTICANKDVWVAVMMAEEHALSPVDRRSSLRAGAIVGFASLLGSLGPIVPFALLPRVMASVVALVVGALLLWSLGALKGRVTTGKPMRSGFALAAIGVASAALGYLIGALVG